MLSKIPTQTLPPLQHPSPPRQPTWTPILLFTLSAAPNTSCLPSRPNGSDLRPTCKGALGHHWLRDAFLKWGAGRGLQHHSPSN